MNEIQTTTTETVVDPICGMQVVAATSTGSLTQEGETYYFCSAGCFAKIYRAYGQETGELL